MPRRPELRFLGTFIVIGDTGTGKSSLFSRYTENSFSAQHRLKVVRIGYQEFKVTLIDMASREMYRVMVKSHFRNATGAMIVYDTSNRLTFDNVPVWLNELDSLSRRSSLVKILVGNKTDLADHRAVSTEEGKSFAEKHNLMFVETSARENSNVKQAFNRLLIELHKADASSPDSRAANRIQRDFVEDRAEPNIHLFYVVVITLWALFFGSIVSSF